MKKLFFITILATTVLFFTNELVAQNSQINWMTFEEALAAQKENPKKIMIDAYTKWCGPCKMLDKNTFSNADLAQFVNENYYAVKFNAEGNETITFKGKTYTNPRYNPAKANKRNSAHQLAGYLGVQAYPTIIFLDENAEFLAPIKGYKTPQQLEIFLKLFASDDHKNVKTAEAWTAYQKEFKPSFQ